MNTKLDKYFCQSQIDWIDDDSPLKIAVKSRQTGFSYANSFRLVVLVSAKGARLDAFISSREEFQAKLQLEDCLYWARLLHLGASELGEMLFDKNTGWGDAGMVPSGLQLLGNSPTDQPSPNPVANSNH